MKMAFQFYSARNQTTLDISLNTFPTSTDPRDTLKRHIIKPKKDFSAFKTPTLSTETRSLTIFQTGMLENVNSANKNCSSCGGAK
jgi:hypothetical protein